jgi:hypothetical protein
MKLDIMGDDEFARNLAEDLISMSYMENVERLLVDCLLHGMFMDMFEDWRNFRHILEMRNIRMYERAANHIMNAISCVRPGLVIHHYLSHGNVKKCSRRWGESDRFFDFVANNVSTRLAKADARYLEKYHPRVEAILSRNRQFEMHIR